MISTRDIAFPNKAIHIKSTNGDEIATVIIEHIHILRMKYGIHFKDLQFLILSKAQLVDYKALTNNGIKYNFILDDLMHENKVYVIPLSYTETVMNPNTQIEEQVTRYMSRIEYYNNPVIDQSEKTISFPVPRFTCTFPLLLLEFDYGS